MRSILYTSACGLLAGLILPLLSALPVGCVDVKADVKTSDDSRYVAVADDGRSAEELRNDNMPLRNEMADLDRQRGELERTLSARKRQREDLKDRRERLEKQRNSDYDD